ncbi:PilZ domain-containing protein [Thalassotalea euphylliae]|uniref:PilZ domain-containing protein n=1 Tax=Thalassotalea euphylliae TaxID=1655234 RepID=UPI00364360C9
MPGTQQVDVINRLNRNLGLLDAGATVTIDIVTPAGKKGKFRTTFIGYMPKQFVLIQFPDSSKLGSFSHYISQGTNITVRGLIEGHEGAVVAFVSPVRQTIQIPSRMMVLEFPKTVSLQSLRSSMRIETDIKAKIRVNNDYWQASIMDLSVNGCQLFINNGDSLLLNKDQQVQITVEELDGGSKLKVDASVCNVKNQVDGIAIGVQFDEAAKKQVLQLMQSTIATELED